MWVNAGAGFGATTNGQNNNNAYFVQVTLKVLRFAMEHFT